MCRGASRWESTAICATPDPTRKFVVQPFNRFLSRILESEYEHTCDSCVRRVTEASRCPARNSLAAIVLPNSRVSLNISQEKFMKADQTAVRFLRVQGGVQSTD